LNANRCAPQCDRNARSWSGVGSSANRKARITPRRLEPGTDKPAPPQFARPTGLHADGAVAALDAGKHVVVEKPLDVTLAAADRILDAEKRSGKTVAVISQHRFDKSSEKVLQAVRDGHLGTITSAIASHAWWRGQSYYDSGGWRGTWALDGGGAVMNQTVHTIDLMTTVVGTPVEVFAYTACLAHERIEVEDTATAVVKFASGALGVIHGTTAAYPGLDASLRVFGSKGSAVISDDELVFVHENIGEAPSRTHPGRLAAPPDQHGRLSAFIAERAQPPHDPISVNPEAGTDQQPSGSHSPNTLLGTSRR
jgi:predicted dehydrogenase